MEIEFLNFNLPSESVSYSSMVDLDGKVTALVKSVNNWMNELHLKTLLKGIAESTYLLNSVFGGFGREQYAPNFATFGIFFPGDSTDLPRLSLK
jgi:hypothetical protein